MRILTVHVATLESELVAVLRTKEPLLAKFAESSLGGLIGDCIHFD